MRFALFLLLFIKTSAAVNYQNVTSDAGINMPHSANKMSTGIAIADFDNNGYPDLFFTGYDHNAKLYFNQGNETFVENPSFLMPNFTAGSCGSAAAADFDNDGWSDLYVACLGNNYLLRNLEGSGFHNITTSSGTNHPERTESVAWGDLNNDGLLDLVLGVHPLGFPVNPNDPNDFDFILFNNGDLTFTRIAHPVDLSFIGRATLALVLTDIDFDHDLDIYLLNDRDHGNVMLRNDGQGCTDWCFTEISLANGADVPANTMGIAVADYDNDSDWDLSYSDIDTHLFLKNNGTGGNLVFDEVSNSIGIDFDNGAGWGTLMYDADNDGWEDLFLATGQSTPLESNIFYSNNQNGTFSDLTQSVGLTDTNRTQAVAWLDFNKDGHLDLTYGRYNQNYQLQKNLGDNNNWLAFNLMGGMSINRDAIGTKIEVEDSNGLKQIRELRSGESRGSNNHLILHFGLGSSQSVDITVTWPDGLTQFIENIPSNQYYNLVYPPYDMIFDSGFEAVN
jgi:hypothetical protein